MPSLTGFKRHRALFFDSSGEYVGQKVFCNGFSQGVKDKVFKYRGGAYNIKPNCSRAKVSFLLSDSFFYTYQINNPDPLQINTVCIPIMDPRTYDDLLESNLVNDLNKSRRGGLASFLNAKVVIVGILILGAILYFATGGSLTN